MPRKDLVSPRGGTAALWASRNPVLAFRELGVETDTKKMKVGDGVTHWNDLPYVTGPVDGDNVDLQIKRDTETNLAASTTPIPDGTLVYNQTTGRMKIGDGETLWPNLPDPGKQFKNVITVAKDGVKGSADFICSDAIYGGSDAACIQAALNKISSLGGGHLHITSGYYYCNSGQLSYTKGNLIISGDGDSTILDFSNNTSTSGYININGALTSTTSALFSSVSVGTKTITITDGTAFLSGDWIQLRSEATFLPTEHAVDSCIQKMGEIQQIESVDGNNITLKELTLGAYSTTDSALVTKVTMLENIFIKDLKIIGNPNIASLGINCSEIYNLNISHISVINTKLTAVSGSNVIIGNYIENNISKAIYPGYGYGIAVLDSSRETYIAGNHFSDCRHGVTTGGHLYGIQYNTIIIGNTQECDTLTVGMFGPHPTYNGMIITNNSCSGCSLGFINGKNTLVADNNVYNTDPTGSHGISLSSSCETAIISTNVIECHNGSGIKIYTEYGNIQVINNNINVSGVTGDVFGIFLSDVSKNIIVRGNTIKSDMSSIKFTNSTGYASSNDVEINNNTVLCSDAYPAIDITSVDFPINDITISGNIVKTTQPRTGIRVTKINTTGGLNSNIIISNNKCSGNAYGINIKNSEKITIDNNKIYNATVGILIDIGSTVYSITNNNLNSCTVAITDRVKESTRVIRDNSGYVTENTGTATVPSTTTSIAVTHSLAATPTKVIVSPSSSTEGIGYYAPIELRGPTTFTITMASAPTGNVSFDWSAEV